MKQFVKLFVIVFLVDIALGVSMSYIVGSGEANFLFEIIDEVISFPVNIWNRMFPEYGIYRATTSIFWLVVILNAFCQALAIFGLLKLLEKNRD